MKRISGLVAANYAIPELGQMVANRPVAAIPFGGRYRFLDFPLSNLVNAGIHSIGLITPYYYRSIMDHVGVGKPWQLGRKREGLFVLPGSTFGLRNQSGKFLMRDMIGNRSFFIRSQADCFLLCSCNQIFNIDFTEMIDAHEASGADATLLYCINDQPLSSYGLYLDVEGDRVRKIERTDCRAAHNHFMDCLLINKDALDRLLTGYETLSHTDLLEAMAENLDVLHVNAFRFNGYVGNIDNLQRYMQCSFDLLDPPVFDELFRTDRTILTKIHDSAPTLYRHCDVRNSSIATGCLIEGTVEHSIVFRNVHIAKGAVVRNSIILPKADIGPDARIENAICDKFSVISAGASLSGTPDKPFFIEKYQEF